VASEPPDSVSDDPLFDPEARGTSVGRSCLTVLAAVGVAGALMAGCTAIVASQFDADFAFLDLSGLGPAIGCQKWTEARAETDLVRAELLRAEALELLRGWAQSDRSLAEALFTGDAAIDAWCASH
jgi:hypothetical protein